MTEGALEEKTEWLAVGRKALIRWTAGFATLYLGGTVVAWGSQYQGPLLLELLGLGFRLLLASWLVVLPLLTLRTRVRLTDRGVEVREDGTTLYPYETVVEVRRNRFNDHRSLSLQLRSGHVVLLPLPVVKRKGGDDRELVAALESIRRRLPVRGR